jgi:hypothetical protein
MFKGEDWLTIQDERAKGTYISHISAELGGASQEVEPYLGSGVVASDKRPRARRSKPFGALQLRARLPRAS